MDPAMRSFSKPRETVAPDLRLAPHPEAKPESPRLSVILVNYKQWEHTERIALRMVASPLVTNGRAEVVIVDNHSGPHRIARQLRRQEGVSVRRWGRNEGFARAVNEGVRLSRGSWILLLNPDMTALPGFLEAAFAAGERLAARSRRRQADGRPVRIDLGAFGTGHQLGTPDGVGRPPYGGARLSGAILLKSRVGFRVKLPHCTK